MFEINPTPFDVRLVAFRIPIRVHWSFWLGMIFFGWNLKRYDLIFLWVVCGFFSILIHELGHALTAESFGWTSHIIMYFGGGLAISDRYGKNIVWRNIIVSMMGPGAGFLFYFVVLAIEFALDLNRIFLNEHWYFVIEVLKFMNLWWGLLNLLPILPLDGGNICSSVCQLARFRDPAKIAFATGAVVAGAAAYYFFVVTEQQFIGMFMLMLCLQNVGALQSR